MDEHAYFEEMREQLRKLTGIVLPIDFPTWTSEHWAAYFENARQMKMEERPLHHPEDFLRVCFGMPIRVFSNFCPPTLAEQETEGKASTVASSSSSIQIPSTSDAAGLDGRDGGPDTHRQPDVSPGPDDGVQQDAIKVENDGDSEKMSVDPTKVKVKREDQQEKKKKKKKEFRRIRFRPVHDWGGRKADVTGLNSNQRRQKRAMFRAHVVRNADKYRVQLQVIVDENAEYRCLARYFLAALDSFMATRGDSSLPAPEVQ
ncbi:unnamed protein product [Tilletia controversa]|uniref:Uncharacterized protein n=2 Tax=Tilletia TaxID=13289 RepID=A0A8X7MNT3_9BASI|nr:hypothetical protein A4X06_0g6372 [Tilletia controversa]KAE8256030.1 hypothetical protein A4X03_0g5475 [Tilletia caries]CAD6886847.1 unnamed protein product [Tilletia caries]CAD6900204.1 unnamed protein product [Tilletia controversa]CAD6915308.1 unnamed protein product [Tilletia caries]